MKLVKALFAHAWLAIRLKHDGAGMPTKIPAAFGMTMLYVTLSLVNASLSGEIKLGSFIALSFIVQFYIFGLRDPLIGLIILIGIITNGLSLAIGVFTGMTEEKLLMLTVMEGIMIFGAVINVIKSHSKII